VQLAPGVGLRDLLEEAQELLVPVPIEAGIDHLAGGDLQRREQGGGAVPDIELLPTSGSGGGLEGEDCGGESGAALWAAAQAVEQAPGLEGGGSAFAGCAQPGVGGVDGRGLLRSAWGGGRRVWKQRWSHGQGELGKCGCQAERRWGVGGEFVVAAAEVWTSAWPVAIRAAERNCFSPRIGRSRAFSRA
jgi:hypothetical protein